METSSKRLEDGKVEVAITISSEEVDKQVKTAYREAAKARIPGFRPGKAPRKILENHYGGKEYFLAHATEDIVQDYTPLAVDGEGFVLLSKPELSKFELVEEGVAFSYTVTFLSTPELTLSSYDPVRVAVPSSKATEADIEEQIRVLLEYYVEFEDVTDRGAKDGDVLTVTFISKDDDIDSDEAPTQVYELGAGMMSETFENNLLGLKAGDVKEFEFFAEADPAGDAKPIKVKLQVKALRIKHLPELTDAWVKQTIEFENVEELRARIVESVERQKEQELTPIRETMASRELAGRLEGDVPDEIVKQTEQNNYKDFYNRLQENRITFDQYLQGNDLSPEKFREEMHEQAVLSARTSLALDALARHLDITVSDEELYEEFEHAGVDDPEAVFKQWQKQGRLSEIRQGISRMKASIHLNDTVIEIEPSSDADTAKKKPVAKASSDADATKAESSESAELSAKSSAKAVKKESAAKSSAKAVKKESAAKPEKTNKDKATEE